MAFTGVQHVAVSANGGATSAVAAPAATDQITVISYQLTAPDAAIATLRDITASTVRARTEGRAGAPVSASRSGTRNEPAFKCAVGSGLELFSSAAVAVYADITYVIRPA